MEECVDACHCSYGFDAQRGHERLAGNFQYRAKFYLLVEEWRAVASEVCRAELQSACYLVSQCGDQIGEVVLQRGEFI